VRNTPKQGASRRARIPRRPASASRGRRRGSASGILSSRVSRLIIFRQSIARPLLRRRRRGLQRSAQRDPMEQDRRRPSHRRRRRGRERDGPEQREPMPPRRRAKRTLGARETPPRPRRGSLRGERAGADADAHDRLVRHRGLYEAAFTRGRGSGREERRRARGEARAGGRDGSRLRRVLSHTGPHTTPSAW